MTGLGLKVEFAKIRSEPWQLYKYVHEQLIKLWKESVRSFIYAASKRVHVDTGMSEASFYPLATKVQLGAFILGDISSKGTGGPKPHYQEGGMKSIAHGQRLGQEAYELDFGTPINPVFKFDFNIVVYQYKLHEHGFTDRWSNHRTAWESLLYGKAAFMRTFHSQFKNYVNVNNLYKYLWR